MTPGNPLGGMTLGNPQGGMDLQIALGLILVVLFAGTYASFYFWMDAREKTAVLRQLERQVIRGTADHGGVGSRLLAWQNSFFRDRNRQLSRRPLGRSLYTRLERAGSHLLPIEFLVLAALFGLAIIALLEWRLGPLGLPIGLVLAILLPFLWLQVRFTRRRASIEKALPDLLGLLSNGLRAGYSFLQALEAAVREGRGPIGEELSRLVRENRVGVPLEDSLTALGERVGSRDLELIVTVILINREVGGNLAEVFDRIGDTIRERIRIRGDLKAMTAQARMSAWVIGLLPPGMTLAILWISPGTMAPLLLHGKGPILLGIGAGMESMGILVLMRIVRVEI